MVHKKFTRRQIVFAAGMSLAVVFVLSFYLWNVTENLRLGYSINDVRDKIQTLREEVKRLKTRKASLLTLERVEKTARAELGLTDPREDQIIYESIR